MSHQTGIVWRVLLRNQTLCKVFSSSRGSCWKSDHFFKSLEQELVGTKNYKFEMKKKNDLGVELEKSGHQI